MFIENQTDYEHALFELRRLRYQRYKTKTHLYLTAGEDTWNVLESLDGAAREIETAIIEYRKRVD